MSTRQLSPLNIPSGLGSVQVNGSRQQQPYPVTQTVLRFRYGEAYCDEVSSDDGRKLSSESLHRTEPILSSLALSNAAASIVRNIASAQKAHQLTTTQGINNQRSFGSGQPHVFSAATERAQSLYKQRPTHSAAPLPGRFKQRDCQIQMLTFTLISMIRQGLMDFFYQWQRVQCRRQVNRPSPAKLEHWSPAGFSISSRSSRQ